MKMLQIQTFKFIFLSYVIFKLMKSKIIQTNFLFITTVDTRYLDIGYLEFCPYTFIPYKSTFRLSRHVFRSQTMFSRLDLIVCLKTIVFTMQAVKITIPVYCLAKFDTS